MEDTFEVRFLPGDRISRVPAGTSVFTAAHWQGVAIESTCGGLGTCGQCRVRIHGGTGEISTVDREFLSPEELQAGWRLACVTPVRQDITCTASEMLDIPRTAMIGDRQAVPLEPVVRKISVRLNEPTEKDNLSDLERLQDALEKEGLSISVGRKVLSELPSTLRRSGFAVTATLSGSEVISIEPGDTRSGLLAVAFDIGTTTVVGSLIDLATGETVAVDASLNRQAVFGGDVISRIAYTMSGADRRDEMRHAIVETMNRILDSLCTSAGVGKRGIYEILTVGNCTMLHLLLGIEARPISVAPFVPAFRDSRNLPATDLGLEIHPHGRVETLPVVGAYVGADTVAGLHATGLARQDDLWLFVDVGTNTEIALGSSRGVVATSAPAGPAFEGSCIRAGMAATEGAIEKVRFGERVVLEVVGGGPPRGICGSGLIDVVAQLKMAGLLDPTGRLSGRAEVPQHPLAKHLLEIDDERAFALAEDLRLTQKDIRELQAAKSSVSTGVRVLLEHFGVQPSDLTSVLLAGSFGSSIDPGSAREIGLVPDVPVERIRFVGNAAAEGARMALVSFRHRQVIHDLARRIEYLELSSREDFNELFVEELAFPDRSLGEA